MPRPEPFNVWTKPSCRHRRDGILYCPACLEIVSFDTDEPPAIPPGRPPRLRYHRSWLRRSQCAGAQLLDSIGRPSPVQVASASARICSSIRSESSGLLKCTSRPCQTGGALDAAHVPPGALFSRRKAGRIGVYRTGRLASSIISSMSRPVIALRRSEPTIGPLRIM